MRKDVDELHFQLLSDIYLKESVAAARNEICALRAEREGRTQRSRLFKAMVIAQQVHANKALMLLRGKIPAGENALETTRQALEQNIGFYGTMLDDAQGPVKAIAAQFLRTAKSHLNLARRLDETKETPYFVCRICGFISADGIPDQCPVCRAIPEKFEEVS